MNGIDRINPAFPNWQGKSKKDGQKKQDRDESETQRQTNTRQPSLHNTGEHGRPHIDEFA
jgi:hypothetical protein